MKEMYIKPVSELEKFAAETVLTASTPTGGGKIETEKEEW